MKKSPEDVHPEQRREERCRQREGATGLHYPVPVHLQKAYASLGHRPGDFPHAEAVARECLSLPLYPGLAGSQQDRVAGALRQAVLSRKAA